MSENKKKVEKKANNASNTKVNEANANGNTLSLGKIKISPINLALIITGIILVGVIIAVATVLIVDFVKKDKGFDYMKSDLSKYVEFTDDYKNFKLDVDIAAPKDVEIDVAILNLLAADKNKDPENGGALLTKDNSENAVIGVGDVVQFWYRGYLIGENGEEIIVDRMTNFSNTAEQTEKSRLEIGSGNFITNFELSMVGINLEDTVKFEKITSGQVNENQVAYVTYTTLGADAKKTTHTDVRMDLSTDIDETFGKGFKEKLLMMTVNGLKVDVIVEKDGKSLTYYDVTVGFVTECEKNPIKIETYFPYDYSQTNLRNEKAIFEIYIDGFVDYTCEYEKITEEYLTKKMEKKELSVTLEELNKYEGKDLVEKYYAFAEDALQKLYEQEYNDAAEQAIWSYLLSIAKVNKYPVSKVEAIYDSYVDDVFQQFTSSGGVITNSYGTSQTYSTLDTYAPVYLGISGGTQTWREYLYSMAESLIKERLVMFYIMREEGIAPSDEDFEKLLAATREEYINEYVEQYLAYEGSTREDYTDAEYEKFVKARENEILSYYDDEYFKEITYYNIVIKNVTQWETIDIVTLDERRAYPLDK